VTVRRARTSSWSLLTAAWALLASACNPEGVRAEPPASGTPPAAPRPADLQPTPEKPMDPRAALEQQIRQARPGAAFTVTEVPFGVAGWSFFDVTFTPTATAMDRSADRTAYTLRADGSVVAGDRRPELGRILGRAGALEPGAGGRTPRQLAELVLHVLGRPESPLDGPGRDPQSPQGHAAPPLLEATAQGVQLRFFTLQAGAMVPEVVRYQIDLSRDLTLTMERRALR